MEEKNYYIYGGFGGAVILILITAFSFFLPPQNKIPDINNTNTENTSIVQEQEKTYSKPKIVFTPEYKKENNYTIKFIKPTDLPAAVETIIEADFTERKTGFLKNQTEEAVVLENTEPQIYQSGKYVSIVIAFSEYKNGELIDKSFSCFTYSQETEKIISLSQALEIENEETQAYNYLSETIKASIIKEITAQLNELRIDSDSEKTNLENQVNNTLSREIRNFLWYLNGDQLYFIYNPLLFTSYGLEEQTISVGFSGTKNYLKAQINSNK